MSKSRIRIGILGSGSMGAEHANAYRAIENIDVVGVFSRSQQRAEAVAQVCGAKPIAGTLWIVSAVRQTQSYSTHDAPWTRSRYRLQHRDRFKNTKR